MSIVEEIESLFARRGAAEYVGEPVSQLEHALQAAYLAEQDGASPALITAALLHDIGHLLDDNADDPAKMDSDLAHEATAARWLATAFPEAVTRPVELHVAAKRYLCATDPGYFANLSPASVASLRLQGGPMSADEAAAFRRDAYANDAISLRRWDERAKVPGQVTPSLTHFLRYVLASGVNPSA
jgi:phosphonate degradation associated HDIG domain protein